VLRTSKIEVENVPTNIEVLCTNQKQTPDFKNGQRIGIINQQHPFHQLHRSKIFVERRIECELRCSAPKYFLFNNIVYKCL